LTVGARYFFFSLEGICHAALRWTIFSQRWQFHAMTRLFSTPLAFFLLLFIYSLRRPCWYPFSYIRVYISRGPWHVTWSWFVSGSSCLHWDELTIYAFFFSLFCLTFLSWWILRGISDESSQLISVFSVHIIFQCSEYDIDVRRRYVFLLIFMVEFRWLRGSKSQREKPLATSVASEFDSSYTYPSRSHMAFSGWSNHKNGSLIRGIYSCTVQISGSSPASFFFFFFFFPSLSELKGTPFPELLRLFQVQRDLQITEIMGLSVEQTQNCLLFFPSWR
jgi:hypothetical protein